MSARFGGCAAAWGVAAVAVTGTTGIVSPAAAGEGCRGMTGDAIQAGRNVRGHRIDHPRRRITVMAGDAIIDDSGMVKGGWNEATGCMADTAILVGRDVRRMFGGGKSGSVTR